MFCEGPEADMLELFGYIELLSDEQRSQYLKSAKILRREARKISSLVRDFHLAASGLREQFQKNRGETLNRA